MNRHWKQLKSEWEVALFALALLALVSALAVGWMRVHAAPAERASRKQAPRQTALLAPDACAFLQGLPEASGGEQPSPFVFDGQTKAPRPVSRQPKTQPKPPLPKLPEVTAKPEPAVVPPPAPVEPTVIRQRVYGVRYVTYLYNTPGASGRPMAAIQLHDPATNQTAAPAMLPIGGVADGIRIVSFDEQNLIVLDARGKRHQIAFGKSARVTSAPHIVEIRQ